MINKREALLGGLGLAFPQTAWSEDSILLPLSRTEEGDLNVQVSINGQGPFTFRVNTGAGLSSIPSALANRLRLQLIGDGLEPYLITVGSMPYPGFRVNAADARFGAVFRLRNLVFMRVPTEAFVDLPYEGVIGSALTLSKPSIFDLEKAEIRFYPNGRLPLDGFQPVPAVIKRSGVNTSAVSVACNFAGQSVSLGVNMTGGGGIYLVPSYVRDHQLWDAFSDYTEHRNDDDNVPSGEWEKFHDFVAPVQKEENAIWRTAVVKNFRLGPFAFDEVKIRMSHPEMKDVADDMAGFIGGDIMSRFSAAFGEKNQLWLKPNAGFNGHIA